MADGRNRKSSFGAAAVDDPPGLDLEQIADEDREALRHVPDPAALTRREYLALLKTSLDVTAAAKLVGVDVATLTQRLERREVYGVRGREGWLVPRFQFAAGKRLVSNLDRILTKLRPDLHPLEVEHWLTKPNPDLTREGRKVSPIDWLSAGDDVARVERLAASLGSWP